MYTFVPKPTGRSYTTVNPAGKEQYDQSSLTYDDINTFYDGVNMNQWTDIPKPSNKMSSPAGIATGLIMPPTRANSSITIDPWTYVPKPD